MAMDRMPLVARFRLRTALLSCSRAFNTHSPAQKALKSSSGRAPRARPTRATGPLPIREPRPHVRNPSASTTPPEPATRTGFSRGAVIGCAGAFVFSGYLGYLYVTYNQAVDASKKLDVPADTSDRYGNVAAGFDSEVDTTERMMLLKRRRKQLARQATGHVLEVSVGTGRNMEYYEFDADKHCKTLTFVDQSPEMIEIAREKFKKIFPRYRTASFLTQSAAEAIAAPPGADGFDTIIQTMGLCSTGDPVGLLKNLGRLANKERGRILLLEHGRSHYAWLNRILDDLAPAHANSFGCWWNKDLQEIVDKSGLKVVTIKRYNFGTTWWIELKPQED